MGPLAGRFAAVVSTAIVIRYNSVANSWKRAVGLGAEPFVNREGCRSVPSLEWLKHAFAVEAAESVDPTAEQRAVIDLL